MTLQLAFGNDAPPLDFETALPRGRITALVGPSGSGKTTILRAIAGVFRPRRSRVVLDGVVWSDSDAGDHLPARLRAIGLVPQNYALFPHLDVLGNVAIALNALPRAARLERARECLRLANVEGLEHRHPEALSGGQKQRVALARAIARRPQVLLLDEPFSAVDRSTRKRLYVELRRLHQQLATTVVLVTHDLEEAAQLASHLCLIHHGRLIRVGTARQVLAHPQSEEAARLLDIPNIFEVTLDARDGEDVWLRWGPYRLHARGPLPTPNTRLACAVLPNNVLLVRADKADAALLENRLPVRLLEIVELGAEAVLNLHPVGLPDTRLQMRLPLRAVHRHRLAAGDDCAVCINPEHLLLLQTS